MILSVYIIIDFNFIAINHQIPNEISRIVKSILGSHVF